jgi:hypothetical protein
MAWHRGQLGGGSAAPFRAFTPEEIDEAELFFDELTGTQAPPRPGWREGEAWAEDGPAADGPLTESEWRTVITVLSRGEVQAGTPLTDDAERNALLVAARIFCDRSAATLDRTDPLLCLSANLGDQRMRDLVAHVTARGPILDWTRRSRDGRVMHIMRLLVGTYGYPVNGAAGLVGNLQAESGVLPQRVEGSAPATPMRAPSFAGPAADFSADEIMNRSHSARSGPRLPGIGLAQWTSAGRRTGLFAHNFRGVRLGPRILFDMDAQVDYLVTELRGAYAGVQRVLTDPAVTVDRASDEVVYSFEVPGALLSDRRRLPRTDPRVIAVFERRRPLGRSAERIYTAAGAPPATTAAPAATAG